MFCKLGVISYGKHNNLHIRMHIGRNRGNPIMKLKLVVLFDKEVVLITDSSLHKDYKNILDFKKLEDIIQRKLDKMDLKLILLSENDFFNRNITTEELLNRLKNENKCIVSSFGAEGICVQSLS